MQVILLNAPPRAGKNTAAAMIDGMSNSCSVIGFSHHLKRMVHGIYFGRKGWDMDPDVFDAIKGESQDILSGMSWRQAYIFYSDKVIKPIHGHEWFGEQWLQAAYDSGSDLIAVPDSGFRGEAERVVRAVGAWAVTLVRIHKDGCTYDGDSRSYISLKDLGVREFDITNVHGEPSVMEGAIGSIVLSVTGRRIAA